MLYSMLATRERNNPEWSVREDRERSRKVENVALEGRTGPSRNGQIRNEREA